MTNLVHRAWQRWEAALRPPQRRLAIQAAAVASIAALMSLSAAARDGHATIQPGQDSVRVPILVYHSIAPHHEGQTPEQRELSVDPAVFERQMRYLADNKYNVISLEKLVDALEGSGPLPERAVVITFDDGWAGQYARAFPILRTLGFTATFFIHSQAISRDVQHMTWEQVRELKDAGMTIGSHSRTHPLLTNPQVSLQDEIEGSRKDIQAHLGKAPDLFAYPFGAANAQAIEAVRAAGYRAARAYPGGPWNKPSDLFALRSSLVTDDMQAFQRVLGP